MTRCRNCGIDIDGKKKRVFCSAECSKLYWRNNSKYWAGSAAMRRDKSLLKSTESICPRCGKSFKKMLYWVGKYRPRIFCEDCREFAMSVGDEENYAGEYIIDKESAVEILNKEECNRALLDVV